MRFVILDHLPPASAHPAKSARTDQQHFDLMFEFEGAESLPTFALLQLPNEVGSTVSAERIADHRKDYLVYEGLVSKNRGEVKRFAFGNWEGALDGEITLQFDAHSANFAHGNWTIGFGAADYSASADFDSTGFFGAGVSLSLKRLL